MLKSNNITIIFGSLSVILSIILIVLGFLYLEKKKEIDEQITKSTQSAVKENKTEDEIEHIISEIPTHNKWMLQMKITSGVCCLFFIIFVCSIVFNKLFNITKLSDNDSTTSSSMSSSAYSTPSTQPVIGMPLGSY